MDTRHPPFLTAAWRDLVMLNYAVDPAILVPRVPRGTTLDLWQGRALVSVVGFRFENTRVLGWAIPGHRHFPEVNLRFYVRRDTAEGPRRGVVFIKEIAPRRAVAWLARWFYNEDFVTRTMRYAIALPAVTNNGWGYAEYRWRQPRGWDRLAVAMGGPAVLPREGSEEAYVIGHYYGFTRQRDGGTIEYEVEHQPWKIWPAQKVTYQADVAELYGAEFQPYLGGNPSIAFVVDGSDILLRHGIRIN